jgi:hypothetical protein
MTGTNSVSMVKLHNFPFYSTKNRKNQLLQKKISNFCIDQFSSFGLKIHFFLHKRHHIDCNLYLGRKKNCKKNHVSLLTTTRTTVHGVNSVTVSKSGRKCKYTELTNHENNFSPKSHLGRIYQQNPSPLVLWNSD